MGQVNSMLSLDAAGLVALADLTTVAKRTVLTGTSSILDCLVIAPGLHRQQAAVELHQGEYPACAAMTTGYVFRVENPAMVHYLQRVGKPGHLTTVEVLNLGSCDTSGWRAALTAVYDPRGMSKLSTLAYLSAVLMTMGALTSFAIFDDWYAFGVLATLVFARACNVFVIRQRARPGWFGASEPGETSDLLILLSQDRWVRLQGPTDDVKAVTSGTWLHDCTAVEGKITALATLLTYLVAALAGNARQQSKIMLLVLLLATAGVLGLVNEQTAVLQMHGRLVKVIAGPKAYRRRRTLADELVKETGKKHWARKLGLLPAGENDVEPPTM